MTRCPVQIVILVLLTAVPAPALAMQRTAGAFDFELMRNRLLAPGRGVNG